MQMYDYELFGETLEAFTGVRMSRCLAQLSNMGSNVRSLVLDVIPRSLDLIK